MSFTADEEFFTVSTNPRTNARFGLPVDGWNVDMIDAVFHGHFQGGIGLFPGYAKQGETAEAKPEEAAAEKTGEDIVDAEFEEVDEDKDKK